MQCNCTHPNATILVCNHISLQCNATTPHCNAATPHCNATTSSWEAAAPHLAPQLGSLDLVVGQHLAQLERCTLIHRRSLCAGWRLGNLNQRQALAAGAL